MRNTRPIHTDEIETIPAADQICVTTPINHVREGEYIMEGANVSYVEETHISNDGTDLVINGRIESYPALYRVTVLHTRN